MMKSICCLLSYMALLSADMDTRRIRHGPEFSLLAPTQLRAGHPVVVSVSLLRPREEGTVLVSLTLKRGQNRLASVDTELRMGDTRDMSVPTPAQLGAVTHHPYSLEVVGEDMLRLERKIFHEILPLEPWSPGHVISVELPSVVRPGDLLRTVVSVQLSDLSQYEGPATISLLSPAGDLVTSEMIHVRGAALPALSWDKMRPSECSSTEFLYQLDRGAPRGLWTVTVSTEKADLARNFSVLDYRPGRVEVTVSLPASVSTSQSALTGTVSANYSQTGLAVCGNLTVTALTQDGNGTVLTTQSLQEPDWTVINMRGSYTAEQSSSLIRLDRSDQEQLRKHFYALNTDASLHFEMLAQSGGAESVRLVATVSDSCTGETQQGWATVRLTDPRVNIRFVGPRHKVVAELQTIGRLETAGLAVESRLVLRNGSHLLGSKVQTIREPGLGVAAWKHSASLRAELEGLEVEAREVRGLLVTALYSDSLMTSSAQMFLAVGRVRTRLQLSISTRHPTVGSNAVFHVRSNQEVRLLHYTLITAGHVTDTGAIHLGHFNVRTFHLSLNSSMVPLATLLVWATDNTGNIITQYINFPVFTNESQLTGDSPDPVNDCSWYESLYSSINDVGLTIQRWEYEEVGCVGVSVWPQSGQADPSVVASLQVRLVSDQERREETEEVVGGCPAGLYWCGDTCYSHNVCHQTEATSLPTGHTNLRAAMFVSEEERPCENGLKVRIIGPAEVKVEDEISLEVILENCQSEERRVDIMLGRSHQYEVSHSVHTVSLAEGERRSVSVWAVVRCEGEVRLVMTVSGLRHVHSLQASGPGYPQTEHTSLMLDLSHHNSWTQHHLNVNNITNNILTLSVTGDSLGPLLLNLRPAVTCFDSVSRLSLLTSHYRYRSSRQLPLQELLGQVRAAFQQTLHCKHPQGGFTVHFNTRARSVWLTGLAVRTLLATSQLSPPAVSVEPSLLDSSLSWIMSLQESDGSFQEREMFPDPGQAPVELQRVSVTGEVVTSLVQLRARSEALRQVIERAVEWLSSQLETIDRDPHPHDLAVAAHSLHVAGSPSSEAAFQLLSKYRVEAGQMMFWGSEVGEKVTAVVEEELRLLSNPVLCCQSLSVRATALALLTYTARRERLTLPIVQWLHSRRGGHSTWTDGVSSAFATEALVTFTLDTETEETSLAVRLDFRSKTGTMKTSFLTLNRLEKSQQLVKAEADVEAVTVTAQGRGRAVIQLSQHYSASGETEVRTSPVRAFSLELKSGLNSVSACYSWLCPDQTGYSGPTVLSFVLPSGWTADSSSLGGEMINNTLYLPHNFLSPAVTCVSVGLYQEFPVRSKTASVLIRLETVLASEHFVQDSVNIPVAVTECRGCLLHTSRAASSYQSHLVLLLLFLLLCSSL